MEQPVLGIDFGATKIVLAVYKEEQVEIILNDQKGTMTPSCVAFTGKERLFMHSAIYQASANPEGTIFGTGKHVTLLLKD